MVKELAVVGDDGCEKMWEDVFDCTCEVFNQEELDLDLFGKIYGDCVAEASSDSGTGLAVSFFNALITAVEFVLKNNDNLRASSNAILCDGGAVVDDRAAEEHRVQMIDWLSEMVNITHGFMPRDPVLRMAKGMLTMVTGVRKFNEAVVRPAQPGAEGSMATESLELILQVWQEFCTLDTVKLQAQSEQLIRERGSRPGIESFVAFAKRNANLEGKITDFCEGRFVAFISPDSIANLDGFLKKILDFEGHIPKTIASQIAAVEDYKRMLSMAADINGGKSVGLSDLCKNKQSVDKMQASAPAIFAAIQREYGNISNLLIMSSSRRSSGTSTGSRTASGRSTSSTTITPGWMMLFATGTFRASPKFRKERKRPSIWKSSRGSACKCLHKPPPGVLLARCP